jgi:hypothetical protein
VGRFKDEDALVDENDDDDDNNETACTNDDAARWLIACLGDLHPKEFVKLAQASDHPCTKRKWMQSAQQPCGAMLVSGWRRNASS